MVGLNPSQFWSSPSLGGAFYVEQDLGRGAGTSPDTGAHGSTETTCATVHEMLPGPLCQTSKGQRWSWSSLCHKVSAVSAGPPSAASFGSRCRAPPSVRSSSPTIFTPFSTPGNISPRPGVMMGAGSQPPLLTSLPKGRVPGTGVRQQTARRPFALRSPTSVP